MSDFQADLQSAVDREFLIERELTGAGMSRVFVATERALQRRVVVKVLPPDLAAGVNIDRFRREIQLAAALQHPHIVPLLAAGDNNGLLWFSMPYIEGESLRSALSEKTRLAPRDVVRILHDVVDALAYAHARGVVHRDIKPDNILASGMHALVTDFGVAKALSAAIPVHGGTTTGMAIGTPAYMAPEQLAADPAADHRVDIYAVGLLAYELLTGHSPFTSSSPQATLAAQLTKVPEPPHRSFTDIPEALSAIIMACLEKDAAKRPQSATQLLAELDALPPMSSGSSQPRLRRRKRTPALLGAITVFGALAVVLGQGARKSRAEKRLADSLSAIKARDVGPGGSRTPAMEVATTNSAARNGGSDGARQRPETVIVIYRDTSLSADGARGVSVPLVISRADSLAIAEAVRQRQPDANAMTAPRTSTLAQASGLSSVAAAAPPNAVPPGRPLPPVVGDDGRFPGGSKGTRVFVRGDGGVEMDNEALFREVRRVFSDSMVKSMRGMDSALAHIPRFARMEGGKPQSPSMVVPLVSPNSDGRTRVVVTNFANGTGRPETSGVGRDLANYLRASLPANRFEVVDLPTTEKAARSAPDRMAMGWMLRADFVVNGVVRERNDSLSLFTIFTDVRGGRYSRAAETMVRNGDTKAAFDAALSTLNSWLDSARTRSLQGPSRGSRGPASPGGL